MNKLDSPLLPTTLTMERFSQADHRARRLIVLIPEDLDSTFAVRRIWEWANAAGAHIQLLSLCDDHALEPALRRRLVRMASLLQSGAVLAELRIESGTNWVEMVKRNSQPEDGIVCFAGQRVGVWNRPLSQILQSTLKNPVYIMSDLSPQNPPRTNWLLKIVPWVGSIGIIAGAFVLQIQIVSVTQGGMETTLLILSTLVEAWLIGVWNSLIR
jgi:hypothetical protein